MNTFTIWMQVELERIFSNYKKFFMMRGLVLDNELGLGLTIIDVVVG